MKHYVLLILMVALAWRSALYAQESCGTQGYEQFVSRMHLDEPVLRQLERSFADHVIARTLQLVDVPVQFHIVRSTAGQSPVTDATIAQAMASMNGYFQNAGLRFFQCAAPKFINDNIFLNYSIGQQSQLVAKSYVEKVVNIYCVGTIEGGTIAGYTYLPGSGQPDIIVMDDGVLATATLTHEMGHYFGLLHTHGSSNCSASASATNELVNGSNCTEGGDYICDTPADPGLLGPNCGQSQVDVNCGYIGSARDANGQLYTPDVRNIMSYSRSGCRDRLSAGQYARIFSTFTQYRTYLKCAGTEAVTKRLSLDGPLTFNPSPVRAGKAFTLVTRIKNTGNAKFTGKVQASLFNRQGQSIGTLGTISIKDTLVPGAVFPTALEFSSQNLILQQETYKVGVYFLADSSLTYELAGNESFKSYVDLVVDGEPLPCDAPDSLKLLETGPSYVLFDWAASKVASAFYRASYREQGTLTWTEVPSWSSDRMVIVNRKPCTVYEFRVKVVCPDGESEWSPIITGKTTGCASTYCHSYGNSLRSYIDEVQIGTTKNNSGNNYGYKDFTNIQTTVCAGGFLSFTLTPGMSSTETPRTVYWRVWADLNQDNDFTDANELLFQISEANSKPVSVIWQMPDQVKAGSTRLRISMDSKEFPLPCAVNDTRDVEDYTLVVCGSVAFDVNPSRLNFPWEGGVEKLTLTSDQPWEATPMQPWLLISKKSGIAGKHELQVEAAEYTGVVSRTGSIAVRANTLSKIVEVRQSGRLVSAEQLIATAAGKTTSLEINTDTAWVVAEKPDWVSLISPMQGKSMLGSSVVLSITCLPNATETPRSGFLAIDWADGQRAEIEIIQDKNNAPITWTVNPTGQTHLVLLSRQLKATLTGLPLLAGDFIGFFYKDGAQLRCAGFGKWSGNLDVISVYADDRSTPSKEGFAQGETFRVKIWRMATGAETLVNAVFAPLKTGALQTHTYRFATNGVSLLEGLNMEQPVPFSVQLSAGYDLFSLPVILQDPDFSAVLQPVRTKVQEVQDYLGLRMQPGSGLNEIGDADVQQGYVSKTSEAVQFEVRGVPVKPSLYPIVIRTGWQIIPFWSMSPKPVAEALSGISSQVVLVKDLQGRNYIPQYGINTIGDLTPGKGYWLMASGTDTLVYPDAYMNVPAAKLSPGTNVSETVRHFKTKPEHPLSPNATLVVLAEGLNHVLKPGDELAVLDPSGRVAGSARFEGENLAVNIYGMERGTPFTVQAWSAARNATITLHPRFAKQEDGQFYPGTLGVLEGVEEVHAPVVPEVKEMRWNVFPNPARDQVTLEIPVALQQDALIRVLRADGKQVATQAAAPSGTLQHVSLKGLPPGPYFIEVRHTGGVWMQKLLIVE